MALRNTQLAPTSSRIHSGDAKLKSAQLMPSLGDSHRLSGPEGKLKNTLLDRKTDNRLTQRIPTNTDHAAMDSAALRSALLYLARNATLKISQPKTLRHERLTSESDHAQPVVETTFTGIKISFDSSVPQKAVLSTLVQKNGGMVSFTLSKQVTTSRDASLNSRRFLTL